MSRLAPWQGFCVASWWGGVAARLVRGGLASRRGSCAASWRSGTCAPWRGFRAADWRRGGACTPWRGFRGAGWRRSRACTPCWDGRRSSVAASLVRRDRVVAADLRVAKGEAEVTACMRRGGGDLRGLKGGQRRNEKKRKEINITLLACPRMGQWRRRDLRGLRGEVRWRGGGLRTRHVGKRGLCNGQKRNEKKKKKKNITLLAYPRMQAVAAAAGVGAKGKR